MKSVMDTIYEQIGVTSREEMLEYMYLHPTEKIVIELQEVLDFLDMTDEEQLQAMEACSELTSVEA